MQLLRHFASIPPQFFVNCFTHRKVFLLRCHFILNFQKGRIRYSSLLFTENSFWFNQQSYKDHRVVPFEDTGVFFNFRKSQRSPSAIRYCSEFVTRRCNSLEELYLIVFGECYSYFHSILCILLPSRKSEKLTTKPHVPRNSLTFFA